MILSRDIAGARRALWVDILNPADRLRVRLTSKDHPRPHLRWPLTVYGHVSISRPDAYAGGARLYIII